MSDRPTVMRYHNLRVITKKKMMTVGNIEKERCTNKIKGSSDSGCKSAGWKLILKRRALY